MLSNCLLNRMLIVIDLCAPGCGQRIFFLQWVAVNGDVCDWPKPENKKRLMLSPKGDIYINLTITKDQGTSQ